MCVCIVHMEEPLTSEQGWVNNACCWYPSILLTIIIPHPPVIISNYMHREGLKSFLIWRSHTLSTKLHFYKTACTQNRIQLMNFIFWSAGCSLLRAQSFSCSLDVLYEGLGISKLQFLINFSCIFFLLHFLVIKTLYPDLELEMLDQYPVWCILWLKSVYPRYVCLHCTYGGAPDLWTRLG